MGIRRSEKILRGLWKLQILMVLWYSTVPACLLALLSGYIFYNYEFEKPALWISVYAVTIRNMWGLFLSILVIGISTDIGCTYIAYISQCFPSISIHILPSLHTLNLTNFAGIMRDILRLPIFRVLGRLTFAAYLIHPTVMRLSFGSLRTPIYVTHLNMVCLYWFYYKTSHIFFIRVVNRIVFILHRFRMCLRPSFYPT